MTKKSNRIINRQLANSQSAGLRELIELCRTGSLDGASVHLQDMLAAVGRQAVQRRGRHGLRLVEQEIAKATAAKVIDTRTQEERVLALSKKIDATLFGRADYMGARRAAPINRLVDATRNALPDGKIPGQDQAEAVQRTATAIGRPRVRRTLWKLAKVGIGAGTGVFVAKRLLRKRLGIEGGIQAGAVAGGVAGLIFSDPTPLIEMRSKPQNQFMKPKDIPEQARRLENLIDQHSTPTCVGKTES